MGAITTLQAAQILQQSDDKSYRAQATGELAANNSVLAAKGQSLNATIKQAHGELADTVSKFSAAGLGMLLNGKLALKGASPLNLRQQLDEANAAYAARMGKAAAMRPAMSSVANGGAVPQTINQAADVFSQTLGGASAVNAAKIDSKVADINETIAKQQADKFKAGREMVQKHIDGVLDLVKSSFDREKQAIDTTTR